MGVSLSFRVLIVEDDPVSLKMLQWQVESIGLCVCAVDNGKEAISMHAKEHFDVIISDYEMPVINGLNVLNSIKSFDSSVPFILVTGYGDLSIIRKAWTLGVFDFIKKPVLAPDLERAVKLALHFGHLEFNRPKFIDTKMKREYITPPRGRIYPQIVQSFIQGIGVEKTRNLLSQFEATAKADLNSLLEAIENKDAFLVQKIFHKLKSEAASVGLASLERTCIEIRRHFLPNWDEIEFVIQTLESSLDEGLDKFKEELDESPKAA